MHPISGSQEGFNSSVGILSVGTADDRAFALSLYQFQFLSRNSVRWDFAPEWIYTEDIKFQFLSRNSVRWDFLGVRGDQVGLLVVSIPQSEFCPLGLVRAAPRPLADGPFQFLSRNSVRWDVVIGRGIGDRAPGFNSSVGILSVGTAGHGGGAGRGAAGFQFLSRNSVRWDPTAMFQ